MNKPITIKKVGICLTERKLIDFDVSVKLFKEFMSVSQFVQPKPKNKSEKVGYILDNPILRTSEVLYGVELPTGDLIWLGEIIDSGG